MVTNGIEYQLLSPILIGAIALGFAWIHKQSKNQEAAKYWAFAYACGSIAFLIDVLRPFLSSFVVSAGSNFFFVLTPIFLAVGFARRYDSPVPLKSLLVVGGLTYTVLMGCLVVYDSFVGRVVALNTGISILFFLNLKTINLKSRLTVDRLIFVIVFVVAVQIFMRAPLVMLQTGEVLTSQNYHYSTFAVSLRFFNTVLSLTLAFILLTACTREIFMEIKRLTVTDTLTGLRNRRGFIETAEKTLKLHQRTTLPVSMIMIDLDFFKVVNDKHGHRVGDEVLKAVAETLSACCRRTDSIARYGGEEFCILLPSANLQMASLVAETARAKLEATHLHPDLSSSLTASFGVAEWKPGEPFDVFFERADAALYSAKEAGRNSIEVFQSPVNGKRDYSPLTA